MREFRKTIPIFTWFGLRPPLQANPLEDSTNMPSTQGNTYNSKWIFGCHLNLTPRGLDRVPLQPLQPSDLRVLFKSHIKCVFLTLNLTIITRKISLIKEYDQIIHKHSFF